MLECNKHGTKEVTMDELQSILINHNSKNKKVDSESNRPSTPTPSSSEIPDVFFDEILVSYKLTRIEVLVLMSLYRMVWCKPNLYSKYGLTPMLSYADLARDLDLSMEDLLASIKSLTSYQFIETVRAGQYFVRKFFTEDLDEYFGMGYDEF